MSEEITRKNINEFVHKDAHGKPLDDVDQKIHRKMVKNILAVQEKSLISAAQDQHFDLEGARKAGYSDPEIMAYLKDEKE